MEQRPSRIRPNIRNSFQRQAQSYSNQQDNLNIHEGPYGVPSRESPIVEEAKMISSQQSNNRLINEELSNMAKPPPPKKMKILEPEPEDKKNLSNNDGMATNHRVSIGENPDFTGNDLSPDIRRIHQLEQLDIDGDDRQAPRSANQSRIHPNVPVVPEIALRHTKQKTTVVDSMETETIDTDRINKHFHFHGEDFYFAEYSLYLFSNVSKLRLALVKLITWKYFEYFITAMIVANSVLLGMMDYTDKENKSWRNRFVQKSETFFTVTFTLEAVCKIIAMGFIAEKGCYLRNAWNWLDFIVVITSLLEVLPGMSNISGLRTFRLFRPLRNLTTVPSMRTLVGTLLQSMAQLGGILSLAIFFFMIFAILGVNLWAGKIHDRCWGLTLQADGTYVNNWDRLDTEKGLCKTNSQCGINAVCDSYRQYLHDNGLSTKDYEVTNVEELNWGITNFDNIWSAFLTIFQCITMEGWTPIMYIYMDAYSSSIVIIYYISCIVSCSLFLLNLTVAVMLSQYEELDKNEGSKDFGELQEQAKKAKLPKRLIKFILENDMVLKKPKKRDDDENLSSILKIMKTMLTSTTPVPDEKYYHAPIVNICFKITVHPIFQTFIMTIIVANTVILAMDQYPQHPSQTQNILDQINLVFTILFTVEVVIKAVGLGLKAFMKEGFNIFDLVIVIISLLEVSLSDGGGSFSALRAFRLFRIFKLFRVGDLRVLIDSIAFTITTIGNYTVLLILFIYVYSLLGMQFFAGKLKFDENGLPDSNGTSPRANFDTLTWSSLTIFQILIGDNWNTVMYDCIRTAGPVASLYFITLILFGNIVMLNLFLAILLGNFDRARLFHMKSKIIEAFSDCLVKDKYTIEKALRVVFPDIPQHMRDFLLSRKKKDIAISQLGGSQVQSLTKIGQVSKNNNSALSQAPSKFKRSTLVPPTTQQDNTNPMKSIESVVLSNAERGEEEEDLTCFEKFRLFFRTKSLFIFDQSSWLRQKCLIMVNKSDDEEEEMQQKLSAQSTQSKSVKTEPLLYNPEYWRGRKISKIFDNFILVLILLSSFSLALQNPLDNPDSTYSRVLYYVDVVFTILFFLECSIKIIALGFLFCYLEEEGREAYLRSAWNILDFIVVAASMTDLMFIISGTSSGGALKSLKALRVLRALRPLRVIGRNEGLRLVVNALLSSIPAMTNVLMVCLLFLMIFAIMGINFFKGQFYSCQDLEESLLESVKTRDDCEGLGGNWKNSRSNFDDIFSAMLSLFEMMTTEGWLTVMWNGVDSKGIDEEPVKNNKTYATIFFMGYMIIGSQFILNLFVGIVIDNFNKIKEKELGNVFLTEAQKEWMELQRLVLSCQLQIKPIPPKNKYRFYCYELINKRSFELFITACIFGNTIIMAIKYYLMPQNLIDVIDVLNYIFAIIFNIEAVIKMIALGRKYFQDNWNLFDFFVVVGTDIGIIVTLSLSGVNVSSAASIVRAFRIMRLFVLIRSAKSIKLIIDTVVRLLPQITNIMSLVLLLFFIYAALGINLFSGVKYHGEITEKNNFRTLGSAFLLLMRCATGEDWNLIMSDLAVQKSATFDCVSNQSYQSQQDNGINGCGNQFAFFYFLSFILLINMLIMNLTIAAVIEGLNTVTGQNSGLVTKENIEALLNIWMHYDPKGKGFIEQDDLIFFFLEVPKPFQIENSETGETFNKNWLKRRNRSFKKDQLMEKNGIKVSSFDALRILKQVEVPVYEGDKVHFKDVYKKLVKQIFRKNQEKRKQKRLIDQLGQSMVVNPEDEEREEDLGDYKLGFKIKQRMKKEWHKRFKALKKVNKNKEMSVTKLHALQIIKKFIDKKRAQKKQQQNQISEPNQTMAGFRTQIVNDSQESEAVSQNLNDTVPNQDSKETQRRLHNPTDNSKKNTISEKYEDFALEMENALEQNQKGWINDGEEEKIQVIPELEFGQQPDLWKTQGNFGNFKSPLKEKLSNHKPEIMDLQTKEKPGEGPISPNAAFVPRIQSRHSMVRPIPTDQDISNDSLFEGQNHENLIKELEDMEEEEIAEYLDRSKELKDSLITKDKAKKKKDLLIVDEVSENREASKIMPYTSLISRNQGIKTEQTDKKLVISFEKQSL